MQDEKTLLSKFATIVGVSPEHLKQYLYDELDPLRRRMLFDARAARLEQAIADGGLAVPCCLVEKLAPPAPRPRSTSDYLNMVLEGVYKGATARGYSALYYVTHIELTTPEYFKALLNKHPQAGIMMLIPQGADMLADVCMELDRRCLIIDYVPAEPKPVHVLNVDNFGAVRELTLRMVDMGHRRIGFITGFLEYHSAADRLEGYKAGLEEAGITFDPELVREGNWSVDVASAKTSELLALDDPPTAIVGSNDLTALGSYEAIRKAGLAIPEDVSVVGFDDIPLAANVDPPLTTVRQPSIEMGTAAADLLIEAMEGGLVDDYQHMYPLDIVMRESTGPALHRL